MASVYSASTTAPVNIATLKYWGKRDKALNLPTNSSISVTLSQDDLRTLTTAAASESFKGDRLWLNGNEESIETSDRLVKCFNDLRALRKEVEAKDPSLVKLSEFGVHIVSENNFPTAAGLASSAAGFAALVRAVADLYKLPQSPSELSKIARKGSGSACRSLFGGFAAWEMGNEVDGSDSRAIEIAPKEFWPGIKAAILVVSASKKDTSSTSGMQNTVATSPLFQYRIKEVVPKRYEEMKSAILSKDFETFGNLTMQDSNQFHAVCLDSTPPIFYMNDTSRSIIRIVDEINKISNKTIAAYTYDAGPNAVIYYEEENEEFILGILKSIFGSLSGWDNNKSNIKASLPKGFNKSLGDGVVEGVSRIILTRVGDGPRKTNESLINASGFPKSL